MLPGFKSRWTMPAQWVAWRARASRLTVRAAARGDCWLVLDVLAEVAAIDPFEDQVRPAVAGAAVVDLHDVRVADPGGGLGLEPEPNQLLGPLDTRR